MLDNNSATLDDNNIGKEISGTSHEKTLIGEGALDASGDKSLKLKMTI